jgi:hypothetical protein
MRKALVMGAMVAGLAAASAGVAVATSGPSTESVTANFRLTPKAQTGGECTGVDGTYFHGTQTLKGKIESSDPRLSGRLSVANTALQNETTGWGQGSGTFAIKDATGATLADGTFILVNSPSGGHGVVIGTLADGSAFSASMSTVADPTTGVVTGEFGQDPALVSSDPAIIQAGSC